MIINFCFEDELLNFDLFRDVIGTTSRAFPDVLISMAYRRPFGYKKKHLQLMTAVLGSQNLQTRTVILKGWEIIGGKYG